MTQLFIGSLTEKVNQDLSILEIPDNSLKAEQIRKVWKPTILEVLLNYPNQVALHPHLKRLSKNKLWINYLAKVPYC